MNFEKYHNALAYPVKSDFQTRYWYKNGQMVASKRGKEDTVFNFLSGYTVENLQDLVSETVINKGQFEKAKREYGEETGRLNNLFQDDLFKDLGIEDNPKRFKLYNKAWEQGHSSGFSEVYSIASDLVELILD